MSYSNNEYINTFISVFITMNWKTKLNTVNDYLSYKNFIRLAILTDQKSYVVHLHIFEKTLKMFLEFCPLDELIELYNKINVNKNAAQNLNSNSIASINAKTAKMEIIIYKIISSITNSIPNKLD